MTIKSKSQASRLPVQSARQAVSNFSNKYGSEIFIAAIISMVLIGIMIISIGEAGRQTGVHRLIFANPYLPDTGVWRFLMIGLSAVVGFLIGWFFSDEGKQARLIAALVFAGVTSFTVYVDNGVIGWSFATFGSFAAFLVTLGYWAAKAMRGFTVPPTTMGSAKWATVNTLHREDVIGDDGFRLGHYTIDGLLKPIRYIRDRHLLTVAPNRSGKGIVSIITNLLMYTGSVVVIDPKGENAMITAEHRMKMGQNVHVVDPWGITGLKSSRFNPLDWLVKGDVDLVENAFILADAIIMQVGDNEVFWTEEAKALFHGVTVYVATDEQEEGQRNLGRVRDLLMLDGEDLQILFKRMLKSPHHVVRTTAARSLQKEEKLLSNVLASVQAQTHFLDSPHLRESLSTSDFTFEDLKSTKMTIYLVLPADRLNTFGRWLRLLIQHALTVNARNIEDKPEKPVLFILDEMAALGKLTMVEQAFGLMAGFGIQLWGIVQDLSQLKRIYGDGWETFISNAGVIQYFGSRDEMTAEYFSKLCGVTTVWNFSTAVARAFGHSKGQGGVSSNESTTTTETASGTQRRLAYADELMRMHADKQLILIENMDPINAIKKPWFKDEKLKTLGRNLHQK